ncbi:hypothetical protein ACFL2Q_06650 [Thermodesulfobacteriota bacterium]
MKITWTTIVIVCGLVLVVAVALGVRTQLRLAAAQTYTIGVVIPNFIHQYRPENSRGLKIRAGVKLFEEMLRDENSVLRKKILHGVDVDGIDIKFRFMEERLGGTSGLFTFGTAPEKIADEFGQSDVVAVIGHMYSGQAKRAKEKYRTALIPLISPKASDPGFADSCEWAFSMIYNDNLQAAAMLEYIKHHIKPEWVALIYDRRSYDRGRYKTLKDQLQTESGLLQLAIKPLVIKRSEICERRNELAQLCRYSANGLVILAVPHWKAARTVTHMRSFLHDVPIIAPDAFANESALEDFSSQYARNAVPPPLPGEDERPCARKDGLSGYIIMVVKESLEEKDKAVTDDMYCTPMGGSRIGGDLWACSRAFRCKRDLEKLRSVRKRLGKRHTGDLFYTDDDPCEVKGYLRDNGFKSALNIEEWRDRRCLANKLLQQDSEATELSDVSCGEAPNKKVRGNDANKDNDELIREFGMVLGREAKRLSTEWDTHASNCGIPDEQYWEELRVLVANPFFYEVAPIEAHQFAEKFRDTWKRQHPRRIESTRYTVRGDPNPTTDALLFVDAAVLVTRALLELPKEHSLNTVQVREHIRSCLRSLERKKSVKGFTGALRFDPEGNRDGEVFFSWIRNDRFRPAYGQFKLLSSQDYERVCLASDVKDRPPGCREWAKVDLWPDKVGSYKGDGVRYLKPRDMVYAGLHFDRINSIDLRKQSFDGEAFVWFKWLKREGKATRPCLAKSFLLGETGSDKIENLLELGPLAMFWEPVQFWNGVYSEEDKIAKILKHRTMKDRYTGESIDYLAFRIKGTFMHEYNLESYPLDHQELPVEMSLFCSSDDALIAVDGEQQTSAPEVFQREYRLKEQEPGVRKHYSGTRRMGSSLGDPHWETQLGTGVDFSVYRASLEVERKLMSYLFKTFLPLLVLNGVSLMAFWIPLRYFDVRMTLTITALLSAIVLYLARTSQLPNVGYATLVDYLFVASYVLMSLNIAAAIVTEWFVRKGEGDDRGNILYWNVIYLTTVVVLLFVGFSMLVGNLSRTEMIGWHIVCLGLLAVFLGVTWYLYCNRAALADAPPGSSHSFNNTGHTGD